MDLYINLFDKVTADGEYKAHTFADDYVCFYWGDSHNILENYTPLAVVTVDDGDGIFRCSCDRAFNL